MKCKPLSILALFSFSHPLNLVGAALFYTSTLQPYTFHNLRQYILHRLLATSTKTYPFQLKAQVVERDSVLVPAGWDSWGKLRVLREGFDCEAVHQGWDSDMDAIADRQLPGFHGARGSYEEVIADPNSKEQVSAVISSDLVYLTLFL